MGSWKRPSADVWRQFDWAWDNDLAEKQAFKLCKMCIFCASQQTKITKRLWKSRSALVNRFQLKSKCIISFFPYLEWISWACYSVHCEILPVRLTSAAESTKHGFSWWFSIDSPMIVEFKACMVLTTTISDSGYFLPLYFYSGLGGSLNTLVTISIYMFTGLRLLS